MNKKILNNIEQLDLFEIQSESTDELYKSPRTKILEEINEQRQQERVKQKAKEHKARFKKQKKEIKVVQKKRMQEDQLKKDKEQEKLIAHWYKVFDYIEQNNSAIRIPKTEVISHEQKSCEIHLFCKYPIFPKRNGEDKKYSADALAWYVEILETFDFDKNWIGLWTGPLGGIRTERLEKKRFGLSWNFIDEAELIESDYFDNAYMFYSESFYCDDFWDDFRWEFSDEGINIWWSYPPYFSIFDEHLANYSQAIWNHFVANWLEY